MAQNSKPIYGVSTEDLVDPRIFKRDIRPMSKRFSDWVSVPNNMVVALLMLVACGWYYPFANDLCFVVSGLMTTWALSRKEVTPLKMPVQSKMLDPKEPNPATDLPSRAEGIFFLGNELKNGKEVWLTNSDCRQHFLVLGTTGAGKAAPVNSFVHTPKGWTRIGDLKVGDKISSPTGGEANVTGIFLQGVRSTWNVNFVDGRSVRVDGEHLWQVHHKHWTSKWKEGVSRAGTTKPRVLTTSDLKDQIEKFKTGVFSVPLTKAVEQENKILFLSPYAMGAMLGDGSWCNKTLTFTSIDKHNIERLNLELNKVGCKVLPQKNSEKNNYIRNISPEHKSTKEIKNFLSEQNLLGLKSWNKFIPLIYKQSSIEQRWALVQGLMDTDRTCDKRKPVLTYCSTSLTLIKDLQEIVWSLGGIAKIGKPKKTSYTYKGEKKEGRVAYILSIRHPEPWKFFSLPRKLELASKAYQYSDSLKLKVSSIDPNVKEEECVCIMVDHPEHLYIMDQYVVTHNTEALLGFAANALSWGSGLLFCDGKGDVSLFAKIYAMARRFGREDDLLVLNFMGGEATQGKVRSNTLNPFSSGPDDTLTNMIVSLMDDAGGDGAMWKGRATAMLTGVMKAMVWLRDEGELDLNVGIIRDYMNLKKIISLSSERDYPALPGDIRHMVKAYLTSLPGYAEEKGVKQAQTTLDQHGYLEMQFTRILGNLADVYGHIFKKPFADIDMNDVVLNRRILVIMLPALEKSGDEIANLGKIVAANLKGMMGSTLGANIEGDWDEVVENRATNSPSPFMVILDEVGYYTVDGMALMAAQARSLGFMMVYASQDVPAMKRLNEKEAASIIANTNTKIFMRTEEAESTGALAVNSADKVFRAKAGNMDRQTGEFSGPQYIDGGNLNIEEASRVSFLDLKSQGAGEMHILFQGDVVRAKTFYADAPSSLEKNALKLRANHFIEVEKPKISDIENYFDLPRVMEKLTSKDLPGILEAEFQTAIAEQDLKFTENDDIAVLLKTYDKLIAAKRKPWESACAAIADVASNLRGATTSFISDISGKTSRRLPSLADLPDDDDDEPMMGNHDMDRAIFSDQDSFAERPEPSRGRVSMPPMAKGRARVNTSVLHGTTIDKNRVLDASKRLSGNKSLMETLSSLNFDEEEVTAIEVETKIQKALEIKEPDSHVDIEQMTQEIDDHANVSREINKARRGRVKDIEEEDDGSAGGKTVPMNDFLTNLLLNEEG